MLSLLDPVELEGLQVFRDDEDPRKFYPMPDQPAIPVDDQGEAEFLFIKYLKDVEATPEEEEAGGGFVMFRSVLVLDPDRRERLVAALRRRLEEEKAAGRKPFGLAIDSTEPLLAAPLWTDGKVSLATFRISDTGLVRHATETVAADLAGDLGASFTVELDDTGAEIFWSAFEDRDQQIPIVISYDLAYKARVSATMSIHARSEVIHRRIWSAARPYELVRQPVARWAQLAHTGTFDAPALRAIAAHHLRPVKAFVPALGLRQSIHQSILDQEIEVRIDTDEAGGDGSVQQALFELATQVLTDRVIPAMFGDPQPGEETAGGGASELLEVQEGALGDPAMRFDLELTSRQTVERRIHPNGPIHLLLDDPEALASSFKELRLTDGFFSLMQVTASTSGVSFERDGIAAVHVFFEYEAQDEKNPARPWVRRKKDDVLKREDEAIHWRFDTARRADGGHQRAYRYRTEVTYFDGPTSVSEWQTGTSRKLLITPRAMGALRVELALTAGSDEVVSARVALRHRAADGREYAKTLELTPQGDRQTWFQFTGELTDEAELRPPEYDYQITYRTGRTEIVMPWVTTSEKTLEIPSPFRRRLDFFLRPQGSFDGVAAVAGDLVYDDPAHRYRVRESFRLGSLAETAEVSVPVLEGGPETARWEARIHFQDGSARDLGSGEARPGTVWIGGETDFLEVQVLPDLLDFETDVQLAVVTLSHDGASKTFTFSNAARAPQTWRVGRSPSAAATYDARIRYIAFDRTKSAEIELAGQTDQVLVLDRSPRG